jgi:predicted RNase H-like nuclease (RuvC/YqgF family)
MKEKAGPQMGLIAQEVEKIYPGAVQEALDQEITHEDGTKETVQKPKMVIYQNLVVPLIKSTQELKQENDDLKAQLSSLEARLRALEATR